MLANCPQRVEAARVANAILDLEVFPLPMVARRSIATAAAWKRTTAKIEGTLPKAEAEPIVKRQAADPWQTELAAAAVRHLSRSDPERAPIAPRTKETDPTRLSKNFHRPHSTISYVLREVRLLLPAR